MGQNGVQKGARPLKTCLQAPQSIHFFLDPNTFKMHCNGLGGPRTTLVKILTPGDRLKQSYPTWARGENGAKWGPKKGTSTKNMLTGTPKHSFFVPNTF